MTVLPEELESTSFDVVRKGYDPTEVRSFLISLARQIRLDDQERRSNRSEANSAATQSDAQSILSAAQQTATSIRAEARRQADDIRDAASVAAKRRLEAAAAVPRRPATVAPLPSVTERQVSDLKAAERRIGDRAKQVESLHKETARLHQQAGEAASLAASDRQQAELLRRESLEEVARLRSELDALNATAAEQSNGPNFGIPGQLASSQSVIAHSEITVIDSSTRRADPLAEAVRSAVGRALRKSG
ncbi:MAG: hypothetical protein V3V01_11160 [Acidimicrobiales bacterium]